MVSVLASTDRYFLVVHQFSARVTDVVEFGPDASEAAYARLFAVEAEHLGHPETQVILLVAESLATLEVTHGSIFRDAQVTHRLHGVDE